MRVVFISDTHGFEEHPKFPKIPDGDVLIHAGDLTGRGTYQEMRKSIAWFAGLPHETKYFIAGNHDFLPERNPGLFRTLLDDFCHCDLSFGKECIYLEDQLSHYQPHDGIWGIDVYGSPYQPWYYDWAFNIKSKEDLRNKWQQIPTKQELIEIYDNNEYVKQAPYILITHGPPEGILDMNLEGEHCGCSELAKRVPVVKPTIHVFGHIHEGYGIYEDNGITYVNASICDRNYKNFNQPIVMDI